MNWFERILSILFRLENIGRGGEVYLRRWHLWKRKSGGRYYLHHVLKSDSDPDPHTHPWRFDTLVLWGGYFDEIFEYNDKARWLSKVERTLPGRFYRRPPPHLHRLVLPNNKSAWTLVHTGKKVREWGFVLENGTEIPHKIYLNENGS